MLIKQGDKGTEVSSVQKLLSLLGYDLIIDGDFGLKTTRSIKSFQKKNNLQVDGIVGEKTFQTLKASQKRNLKESGDLSGINYGSLSVTKDSLDSNQYIKQSFDKKQIYLHFTAGGPIAKNTISGWNADDPRIATAYVIDGNSASIVECFDPSFWSYHLGVKGTRGKLDKSSIGIEICNWGPLDEKDGKFYSWPAKTYKKWESRYEVKKDDVIFLDTKHRGYKHYHKITEEQIKSVEKLLIFLVKKFNISVNQVFDSKWNEFQDHVINNQTPGIWNHVNVRKDKSDLCPDDRIINMLNGLKDKI